MCFQWCCRWWRLHCLCRYSSSYPLSSPTCRKTLSLTTVWMSTYLHIPVCLHWLSHSCSTVTHDANPTIRLISLQRGDRADGVASTDRRRLRLLRRSGGEFEFGGTHFYIHVHTLRRTFEVSPALAKSFCLGYRRRVRACCTARGDRCSERCCCSAPTTSSLCPWAFLSCSSQTSEQQVRAWHDVTNAAESSTSS